MGLRLAPIGLLFAELLSCQFSFLSFRKPYSASM
jgi:hypothetical protein